jgi:RNA binding exosome subunit
VVAGGPTLVLGEKLAKNRPGRDFFKYAIDRLGEEEWQELLSQLRKRKNSSNYGNKIEFFNLFKARFWSGDD